MTFNRRATDPDYVSPTDPPAEPDTQPEPDAQQSNANDAGLLARVEALEARALNVAPKEPEPDAPDETEPPKPDERQRVNRPAASGSGPRERTPHTGSHPIFSRPFSRRGR